MERKNQAQPERHRTVRNRRFEPPNSAAASSTRTLDQQHRLRQVFFSPSIFHFAPYCFLPPACIIVLHAGVRGRENNSLPRWVLILGRVSGPVLLLVFFGPDRVWPSPKRSFCWAEFDPSTLRAEFGPAFCWAEIGPTSLRAEIGPILFWADVGPDYSWVGFGPFIWAGPTRIFVIYIL